MEVHQHTYLACASPNRYGAFFLDVAIASTSNADCLAFCRNPRPPRRVRRRAQPLSTTVAPILRLRLTFRIHVQWFLAEGAAIGGEDAADTGLGFLGDYWFGAPIGHLVGAAGWRRAF